MGRFSSKRALLAVSFWLSCHTDEATARRGDEADTRPLVRPADRPADWVYTNFGRWALNCGLMLPSDLYELLHDLRSSPTPLRRLPAWGWNMILEHLGHAPTMARDPGAHRRGAPCFAPSAT